MGGVAGADAQSMAKPGWAAVVHGNPADLQWWADQLKPDLDGPWVETHGSETLLRSPSFTELATEDDVRDRAVALIARLNGGFALAQQAGPVRFAAVVKIDANGVLHQTVFVEGSTYELTGQSVALVLGAGVGGGPSVVQRWSAIADNEELLNDALIYFGRATNWFDVYKAVECLEARVGGESKLMALGWASEKKIELLKRTANCAARHRRGKYEPPASPMSIKDARALLGQLLQRALQEADRQS